MLHLLSFTYMRHTPINISDVPVLANIQEIGCAGTRIVNNVFTSTSANLGRVSRSNAPRPTGRN